MINHLSGYNRAVGRAFRHRKLILVCFTLTTFVAIYHSIGSRNFRTVLLQKKDSSNHESFYSRQRSLHLRSIQEATEVSSYSTRSNPNNSSTETSRSTPKPKLYRLGPKIRNWDKRRREWLKHNPTRSNFIESGKPRVLLVTGSAPGPCENPSGDHFLLKSMKNKVDYCRMHGCEVYYNMAVIKAEMSGYWGKLPLLRKLMVAHPDVEFFWWMDSDALLTDMAFEVPWNRYKEHNLVLPGWSQQVPLWLWLFN